MCLTQWKVCMFKVTAIYSFLPSARNLYIRAFRILRRGPKLQPKGLIWKPSHGRLVLAIFISLDSWQQAACSLLTSSLLSMHCHPLLSVLKHENFLSTHHFVKIAVHVVNIQSTKSLNMPVSLGSRQHVEEVFVRVRRGGRKLSLVCMEHWTHSN